jgi:protein O-mannosyl-transferase
MVDLKKKNLSRSPGEAASHAGKTGPPRQGFKGKDLQQQDSKSKVTTYLILGGVLVLTFILFSNALHNKFLDWDDNAYLRDNPDIKQLNAHSLKAFFTNYYVGNWQPLTILSYAIEYSFVQLRSTFLYHLDNVLLHIFNVALVFWFVIKISRNKWVALLTALFFAINPLRVESVAWIAERKDVLYSFFFILSLIAYTYYLKYGLGVEIENTGKNKVVKGKAALYYAVMLVFFVLSALSKSAAVVLPVVLFLIDYFYRRKIRVMMFLEKLPLFLVSVFLGFMAFKSQGEAVKDIPLFSFFEKILIVNHSFLRYICMSIIPVKLSALHPYPYKPGNTLPVIYYLAPIASLGLITGLVYSLKFTRRPVFGILFFLVTIALVLQLIPVGGAVISERYTYIPSIALFYLVSYYLVKLWDSKSIGRSRYRLIVGVLVAVGLITYSGITYSRNTVWKDDISLWDDAIAKDGNINSTAYFNRGKARQDAKDPDGALDDYNKAFYLRPNYDRAVINRGIIKQDKGDYTGALADYNKGIEINPTYYIVYNNRGAVKKLMGDLKGAREDFEKSVKLNPNIVESLYNLGTVKFSMQDYKAALVDFDKTIEINPQYVKTYNYRGATKIFLGDKEGACKDWKTGYEMGDETCKSNMDKVCK